VRRRRSPLGVLLRTAAAAVVAVVVVFPLYWMLVVALSSRRDLLAGRVGLVPHSLTTENFTRVLEAFPVGTWLSNSVAISVSVAVLTALTNLLAGYAFAHLRFRGSSVLFVLALGTLVLPVQVIMVALFRLVTELQLYGTYWAVILPTSASALGMFLARQYFVGIPRELLDAARLDGAGEWRTFTRIVLPMSRPLVAVLFFMSLLSSWNDFAWPLIALKDNDLFTLPIGLLYLQGQYGPDYTATMAFALLNVAPMVVLFLVFQRFFVQGFTRSGLR
jgi:multiple sugar transport system permease protein